MLGKRRMLRYGERSSGLVETPDEDLGTMTITAQCPECGHSLVVEVPLRNAAQWFHPSEMGEDPEGESGA